MADVIDADLGFVDNDAAPLIPRRPAHLDVIERHASEALAEIRAMTDAAMLAAGFTQQWINRSRGQRRRYATAKARDGH